jgi:NADPH:quinone reductase-like Zn-dependent oxidoreductase
MSLGSRKFSVLSAKSNNEDMAFVANLVKDKKLTPVNDRSFKLSQTPDAFKYIKEKHAQGKVIINIRKQTG